MNWRGWVLIILLGAIVALTGVGLWILAHRAPAQILTLPNGMEYRFTGVTHGTNHVMESRWSAMAQKLPRPIATLARKLLGNPSKPKSTRNTAEPSLAVWFEPVGTNAGLAMTSSSMMAMLVDENGIVSGERKHVSVWSGRTSPQWISEVFEVWPRRSRILGCVLFQYHYGLTDTYVELGRFKFRNPVPSQVPQWKPDPLPATKPAGDIQVTLHDFLSGVGSGSSPRRQKDGRMIGCSAAEPGREPEASVRFTIDTPRGTNETWAVAQFYLSDVTGNHHKATSWSHSVGRPAHFSPVLWPGEAAWKLTTRFKRTTGFPESDLLVFGDVPLPKVCQTNEVRLTNTVNDIECVLESIVLRPPMTNSSYSSRDLTTIQLKHTDLPDEFAVDLISVTFADPAVEVKSAGSSWGGSKHETPFRVFPTNQTHATLTYAVQKTREVEFLVDPNWVRRTNQTEIQSDEN